MARGSPTDGREAESYRPVGYKRRDVSTTRRPGRLFTFRLQQSEYFDGQRFRIDSHDIPFSHGMDWQQSRREATCWDQTSRLVLVAYR